MRQARSSVIPCKGNGDAFPIASIRSLIEQLQADVTLVGEAVAAQMVHKEGAGCDAVILDDVTPRLVLVNAMLNACTAQLNQALLFLP